MLVLDIASLILAKQVAHPLAIDQSPHQMVKPLMSETNQKEKAETV